ncbi:glycoside hydrolase family 43 protein [Pedobacter alpinus]|uniref:Glycoside hydrolase family 43 protein n=1 Tax=Pedobacter alpinus TaxID=1590643 RepID=A0ABW5TVP9_9SPHI
MKIEQIILSAIVLATSACTQNTKTTNSADSTSKTENLFEGAVSQPLITERFSADPSAHVFDGKIFIYPSHDYDAGMPENDNGDHFAMKDYYVYSLDSVGGKVTDYPMALTVEDVPWAVSQMWAPDIAFKNGKYYFYFPARDKDGVFRIGVAESDKPQGPFKAETQAIKNSFSIDPAVFTDTDGKSYMYFGGIWGGQLQKWATGKFDAKGSATDLEKDDQPALSPKMAMLAGDMKEFAETPKDIKILDENGKEFLGGNHEKRFFEASWMHKYNGKYYFSYSTGDTHKIVYATGDNPYGPFTYHGVILNPVVGWTSHHSIVEFKGKWYLFYHDTQVSGGKTHLRNVKVIELKYDVEGKILPIDPYGKSAK